MTAESQGQLSHRELRELVGAYALGQLSGERWRTVHDHLEVCATCRADLEEIAPVAGLLGVARDRLRPDQIEASGTEDGPPPLSPALLTEVRAESGGADVVPLARRPDHDRLDHDRVADRRGGYTRWLAAAAVLVALATGAGYALGSAGRPAAVPLEAIAVRALDPAVRAQANLVAHTWGMEVKLTASGFAPGARYIVTVTDDAGRAVGAGEFIGTGPEEMRCNLNSGVLRAEAATVQVRGTDGRVVLDATV